MKLMVRSPRTVLAALAAGLAGLLAGSLLAIAPSANAEDSGSVQGVSMQARYSPLGATANGPSGPATAKFTAGPYCCPSTAIVLTPQQVIGEGDFQWLNLGLPWDNAAITSIDVCYAISTSMVGTTYISQTRVTEMTTPNSATVRVDDSTDRTTPTANCYTVPTSFTPSGTLTLALKVVFGSTSDRITIGMVKVGGVSP
ncbi:hypothetical protein [Micromonospora polyrhachis]|uniref:Secreted protein n=1 Tax=Micromonospora polyrhachis TaxID=1282883 RepID=A0A7W7SRP6_9ACTN|nr:hypothetical protein [Micromonospora polyrhachis]MBB4958455.1 hypothetical protein [Micromonospora polyrhachis]